LYHDVDLNYRLVQKAGILANLDGVTWDLLKTSIRLIDGQRIPKVEEALTLAVDSTTLRYVWLDIKGNPDVFKFLEPIVRSAMKRAADKGRRITIISDIPSKGVLAEYYKQPSYAGLPLMYELELDKAIELGCKYWGPRWTEGTLTEEVKRAHSLGIKVYVWTIDSEAYVESYLNAGFDGMITDYPAYVAFHHYIKP
jgi:glycerophosphoryl diester phosphodiesterase